jgi:ribokinase
MPRRVCVLGSLTMDIIVRLPRLPVAGETCIAEEAVTAPGGKGLNQALAAARLGAAVSLLGCIGDDAFGLAMLELARAAGLDVTGVQIRRDAPTAVAVPMVLPDGNNCIVAAGGANQRLTRAAVEAARATIAAAEILLVQLETPIESVLAACEIAHAAGARVILNAAPALPLPAELWQHVDVLVVNEVEAAARVGTGEPAEQLARLHALGPSAVVITLGAAGCVGLDGRAVLALPAHSVTVVDAIGAGDAFCGAFAVALADDASFEASLRFASAAAAISVTRAGAASSLPARADVLAMLAMLAGRDS